MTSSRPRRPTPIYAPPPVVPAPGTRTADDAARAAGVAPTSPRAGRCSSSTTRSCSRAPCAGPRRPTPPCSPLPAGGAIAVSIDGNGRRVACDPRRGAAEAVLECAANLACAGAEPLGLTNCLNFGNPEKPHVAWQLDRGGGGNRAGLHGPGRPGDRGQRLALQRGPEGPIFPTPVIGMVGRLPDAARAGRLGFAGDGDAIALVGSLAGRVGGRSELAKLRGEPLAGPLPGLNPSAIRATHAVVREAVRAGALASAHDVAEGGLAVALAECCLAGGLRCRREVPAA